jgi:uncharacterized protein with PIN domain
LTTVRLFGIVSEMSKADEPETIACYFCGGQMTKKHRVETEKFVRVLWHCTKCPSEYWKMYGQDEGSRRERRQRWH